MKAGSTISTVQEMDALPVGSVVADSDSSYSSASVKITTGEWVWASGVNPSGFHVSKPHQILDDYLTVVFVPERRLAHTTTDRAA